MQKNIKYYNRIKNTSSVVALIAVAVGLSIIAINYAIMQEVRIPLIYFIIGAVEFMRAISARKRIKQIRMFKTLKSIESKFETGVVKVAADVLTPISKKIIESK